MMKRVQISDWMKANLDKYKELSAEQERELYERISLGDEEAIQELALSAWRFAAMEIERQCCDFLDGDDLLQDVIFGLMDAAKQYIPALGRFSYAAGSWIRRSVSNAIKKYEKNRACYTLCGRIEQTQASFGSLEKNVIFFQKQLVSLELVPYNNNGSARYGTG